MNLISRAISGELLLSSRSSSRKCLLLLQHQHQHQHQHTHTIAVFQNHSSLYSTTATNTPRLKKQHQERYNAKKPKPQQQESSSSSSRSGAETVHNQTQVSQKEIEIEEKVKGLKKEEVSTDWPRPSEIPWQAKVANSINLIGHVQIPVQFEASPDGKYWAGTIISQRDEDSSDSPPFWVPIIFEGDLAHIAACHLKAKDWIYIAGQLSADPPPFTMSQGQANVQVMVRSINFVQGSSQMKKSFTPHKLEEWDNNGSASMKRDICVNQLWKDLVAKPHEWWDIRMKKGNSMAVAFEHKDNGQLLWINESTPEWIQKELECLTFDHKIVQKTVKSASDTKDDGHPALSSWGDLLRNPQEWWDNRENKLKGVLKPKHPDFKHKDSGLALWLNTAPKWVLSELDGLEADVQLPKVKQAKESKGDNSWKNLVENPNKWWDNRTNKLNQKAPDFRHRDTGEGLWLSDSPAWVSSRLPPLTAKHIAAATTIVNGNKTYTVEME